MTRAVFLDRDGTIIKSLDGRPALKANEVELMPSALDGLRGMQDLDYKLIVVSNQSGISTGKWKVDNFYITNEKMRTLLLGGGVELEAIYHCPHARDHGCACRKPKPGMLLTAARKHNIALNRSFMVGDYISDIGAGKNAGCKYNFLVGRKDIDLELTLVEQNYEPDFKIESLVDMLWHLEGLEYETD